MSQRASSRAGWFPGFGGLCAHHVLADPRDGDRMWVGISAVGVFATEDGGETWARLPGTLPRILSVDAFTDEA